MKKNILLQLLFTLNFCLTCAAQTDRIKPIIKTKIASPRKDCESGFNFCITYDFYHFRQVDAGITLQGKQIQFHLLRSTMDGKLESELLPLQYFIIEDDTPLSMDLSTKIGMMREVTLQQGRYPIEVSDEYISITCTME